MVPILSDKRDSRTRKRCYNRGVSSPDDPSGDMLTYVVETVGEMLSPGPAFLPPEPGSEPAIAAGEIGVARRYADASRAAST